MDFPASRSTSTPRSSEISMAASSLQAQPIPGRGRGYVDAIYPIDHGRALRLAGTFYGMEVDGRRVFDDGSPEWAVRLELQLGHLRNPSGGSQLARSGGVQPFTESPNPLGQPFAGSGIDFMQLGIAATRLPREQGRQVEALVRQMLLNPQHTMLSGSCDTAWTATPLRPLKHDATLDISLDTPQGPADLVVGVGGVCLRRPGEQALQLLCEQPIENPMSAIPFQGRLWISGRSSAYVDNSPSAVLRIDANGAWERVGDWLQADRARIVPVERNGRQLIVLRTDNFGREGAGVYVLDPTASVGEWRRLNCISPRHTGRSIVSLGDVVVISGSADGSSGLTLIDPWKDTAQPLADPSAQVAVRDYYHDGLRERVARTCGDSTPMAHPTRSLASAGEYLLAGFPAVMQPDGSVVAGAVWNRSRWIPIHFPIGVELTTAWCVTEDAIFAAAAYDGYVACDGEYVTERFQLYQIPLRQ